MVTAQRPGEESAGKLAQETVPRRRPQAAAPLLLPHPCPPPPPFLFLFWMKWEWSCRGEREDQRMFWCGLLLRGSPLRYSCLENPTDGVVWWATVHGVAKSRTRLSDSTSSSALKRLFRMTFLRLPWWSRAYESAGRRRCTGFLPGLGRSPRPATEQLSPSCHSYPACALDSRLGNKRRPPQWKGRRPQWTAAPARRNQGKACKQPRRSRAAKNEQTGDDLSNLKDWKRGFELKWTSLPHSFHFSPGRDTQSYVTLLIIFCC